MGGITLGPVKLKAPKLGGILGGVSNAINPAEYIVEDKGVFYRIDKDSKAPNGYKVKPYEDGISPEDKAKAIPIAQFQQRVAASNSPQAIAASMALAQAAAAKVATLTGKPLDHDLDDNVTALAAAEGKSTKGKGAAAARTAAITAEVIKTRPELIAELTQRRDEIKDIKKKDHPELFVRDPVTGITPRDQMIKDLDAGINTLRDSQNLNGAMASYKAYQNPTAAPGPTAPGSVWKP